MSSGLAMRFAGRKFIRNIARATTGGRRGQIPPGGERHVEPRMVARECMEIVLHDVAVYQGRVRPLVA